MRRVAALPITSSTTRNSSKARRSKRSSRRPPTICRPCSLEDTYRRHPELREHRRDSHACGRHRRYKKRLARKSWPRISPTGSQVRDLRRQHRRRGPGRAIRHGARRGSGGRGAVYEAMPGMRLSDIARGEEVIGPGNEAGHHQLHPLTRDAAALLLDQPEFGQDAGPSEATATRLPPRSASVSITWRSGQAPADGANAWRSRSRAPPFPDPDHPPLPQEQDGRRLFLLTRYARPANCREAAPARFTWAR